MFLWCFQIGRNSISLANAIPANLEIHRPFKHVGILNRIIGSGVRTGHADEVAQLGKEQAVVGAFSTTGKFPAGFKFRISHR